MMKPLARNGFARKGPLVFVIMDGVGLREATEGNAFFLARTPVLDRLMHDCPLTTIKAHGTAVGLPSDEDMGNSEVGHNALGAGRDLRPGRQARERGAIESGDIFTAPIPGRSSSTKPAGAGRRRSTSSGLLSDGNVHSHIDHLFSLIEQCADGRA